MNATTTLQLLVGFAAAFLLIPILSRLVRLFAVEVDHEEVVLVLRFGKLSRTLPHPGWHWLPDRVMPWVRLERVSLQRDFRHFRDIHINDSRGTTMRVDLWLELRIVDPKKALFEVADWNRSLSNLVQHSAISILGSREFQQILTDRIELGELLKRDIGAETARWGIAIEQMFVRNVNLLPELSRQIFQTIAARLERAKADIEEEGRLRVATLDAQVSLQIASLTADAKGQYPAALGRAFTEMAREKAVLDAYNELYELSLLRPHRTIAFTGFQGRELSAAEAAMVAPPLLEGSTSAHVVPPLGGREDHLILTGTPAGTTRGPRTE
jgi:regulator of protease activity HflC (stomatin/prohibitin superfamily)